MKINKDLLIDKKGPSRVIYEYKVKDLIEFKNRNHLLVCQLIKTIVPIIKGMNNKKLIEMVNDRVNTYLVKTLDIYDSFDATEYYNSHYYQDFVDGLIRLGGYKSIVTFLEEMYRFIDYNGVRIEDRIRIMNIFLETRNCCSDMQIYTPTEEQLLNAIMDPIGKDFIKTGLIAVIDDSVSNTDAIIIDSVPYLISCSGTNKANNAKVLFVNEVSCKYKSWKYEELKELSKRRELRQWRF